MFKKINLNLNELDAAYIKGQSVNSYGDTFHEFDLKNAPMIQDAIQNKIKFNIPPSSCLVTQILSPGAGAHTDKWPTAMNYYFDAGNDVTYFFEELGENKGYGHREIKRYNASKLKCIGTFVAKKNDCYLLNTHVIHSVIMPGPKKIRTMLRFVWQNHTYDEVLNSIDILDT